MGCNCGKGRKTRPFGPSSQQQQQQQNGGNTTSKNTSSGTGRTESYVLRTANGTMSFGSRLEAEATKRRVGGGSIVKRFS